MVLFRVDILPIFLEEIDVDDQRIVSHLFIFKNIHYNSETVPNEDAPFRRHNSFENIRKSNRNNFFP